MIMYFLLNIKNISFQSTVSSLSHLLALFIISFVFSLVLFSFFSINFSLYATKPLKLSQHIGFCVIIEQTNPKKKNEQKRSWRCTSAKIQVKKQEKCRKVANIGNWHKHSATMFMRSENIDSFFFLLRLVLVFLVTSHTQPEHTLVLISFFSGGKRDNAHGFQKWLWQYDQHSGFKENTMGNGF